MNDTREVEAWNLNILNVRVEQLEKVVRHTRLVRVLHPDPELILVGGRQIQSQGIVVAHRLNELEQVDHVHAQNILGRAVIGLKAVGVETKIDEYRVSLVYGDHLDSLAIKLQVRLRKNLLQGLNQRSECTTLDGLDLK